jgi:hypothetical protein
MSVVKPTQQQPETKIVQDTPIVTQQETPEAPLSDLVVEAEALPNIDQRDSVLLELPADLIVEGRDEFGIEGITQVGDVGFGSPKSQHWVRCHPGPGRFAQMYCIKDKKGIGGRLYPVTRAPMVQYPKLQVEAKLYLVRQACIWDSGDHSGDLPFLWAAPLPGRREAPSDRGHRNAQTASLTQWVQMRWVNGACLYDFPEKPERLGEPFFPEMSFAELLRIAIADLVITDVAKHDFARDLLGL